MRRMPAQPTPDLPAGLFAAEAGCPRCSWCQSTPLYRHYHDTEWGFTVADDRRLFLGEGQFCFVTERTIVRPPGDT